MTPPLSFLALPGMENKSGPVLRWLYKNPERSSMKIIREPGAEPFVYPIRVVWIGPKPEGFDFRPLVPPPILEAIRHGKGVVLMDGCDESRSAEPFRMRQLHDALRQAGIPVGKAMLLTQNRLFPEQLGQWQKESGEPEIFHCGYYHIFLRYLIDYVRDEVIPSGEFALRRKTVAAQVEQGVLRDKYYLCLNFTPRLHRIATMLYLLRRDLLDRGIVSFSGLQNFKLDMREGVDQQLPELIFPEIHQLLPWLPRLRAMPSLRLDADLTVKKSPATDIGQTWYYERTCFSLVTETDIDSQESRRYTEKSFKPILGLHPFLIMGVAHTLADLRTLGFRTFDNFINPSYDGMEDTVERLSAVLAEFERLCQLPLDEWARLHRQMLPDLLYNYDYFGHSLEETFVRDVENPLLAKLRQIAMAPAEPRV